MISKNHLFAATIFALLSTVLIVSWFRYGHLYGGGDVGIPSYDPPRIIDIARFVWWEDAGPGSLVPHGLTSLPVQFFQSALNFFGLPYFMIQATLFFFILFVMSYGMFWVGLSVFGKDKFFLSILCGLFYLLNPYMMIQVWHRFIHNSFFLAAFLPLFYLFWDDWINRGKFTSILFFLLANFLGVYLYGTIAYLLTIPIVLSFIFLKANFIPWQGFIHFKKTIVRFIVGFTLWVLIHAWWMLPTFSITPALFSAQHRIYESVATLVTLSKQTIMPYVVSGINPFYLFERADFGEIYKHPIFLIIMWLPLLFLIPGFIASVSSRLLSSWALLLLAAVFLAKGAAVPFGFIYVFFFSQIFILGVLRNPYEKLGILLPFSLAVILTAGFKWYMDRFAGRIALTRVLLGCLLFLQLGVFLWPLWAGKLIGKYDKLALIDVPRYYQQADNFIKEQKKDGKILHLPLPPGEAVAYTWPFNFSGIESSQLLFKSLPSISRALNLEHVDDIISAASNIFREDIEDEKIVDVLGDLNVRFIVLHKDTQWQGGFLDDPLKLEKILDGKKFLKQKGTFGELIIYELKEEYFKPRLYATSQINLLSKGEKNSFWPYFLLQNNKDMISSIDGTELPKPPLQNIVIPTKSWIFQPKEVSLEKATNELPAISKISPLSNFYFLINLKENLLIFTSAGSNKLRHKINFAGKRLIEASELKEAESSILEPVDSYRKLIGQIFDARGVKAQVDSIGGRGYLEEVFNKHLVILENLSSTSDGLEKERVQEAKEELARNLAQSEITPFFAFKHDQSNDVGKDIEYAVYHFNVPSSNQYELLMVDPQTAEIYKDRLNKLEIVVDGQKKELVGQESGSFLSYGRLPLEKGKREFILLATPSANLFDYSSVTTEGDVTMADEIKISSTQKESSFLDINFQPLTANTWYTIKFDAWIQKGDSFRLLLIQDTDSSDLTTKERFYSFDKIYTRDSYNNLYQSFRLGILLDRPASTQASIRFVVPPWEECGNEPKKEICFNRLYAPRKEPSTVVLRNIRIERLLNNQIFLRSQNDSSVEDLTSRVNFAQHSPVLYSGKIELESEGFIIFSETFHKDWQLRLFNSQESFMPERKFLANMYANAWYIPKAGQYNFELEFTPQKTFYKGLVISLVAFSLVIAYYLIRLKNDQQT